jgi:hypothetical protein
MGERVRAGFQTAYELRSGWKVKDAISGLVMGIVMTWWFEIQHGNCRDRLSLAQSCTPTKLCSLVAFLSSSSQEPRSRVVTQHEGATVMLLVRVTSFSKQYNNHSNVVLSLVALRNIVQPRVTFGT